MHMANELLSVPVATGTLTMAGVGLGYVCRQVRKTVTPERLGLMGMLGAFVFAAQMINLPLPGLPGTSGHLVGAVLVTVILGPHAGALVIASIVMVQCLIFQDGGLLALGCNIINMALVPTYLGHAIIQAVTLGRPSQSRLYLGTALAALITVEVGASMVPLEAGLSGVLTISIKTFLVTMLSVHLVIGLMESVLTVAVLGYLRQLRPDILKIMIPGKNRVGRKTVLVSLGLLTLLTAGVLSLFASNRPDGLEWSYADRPDQPQYEPVVRAPEQSKAVDQFQDRYAPLPGYSRRAIPLGQAAQGQANGKGTAVNAGWTSFAGVVGSILTMGIIWLIAYCLRKRTTQV